MVSLFRRERAPLWGALILGLLVWTLHSLRWWAHLEGDAPLYPYMSVKVLEGRHFWMTDGQAHGGTLLVYLRAGLFKLFGVSHFIGFFVNGIFVTAGLVLWTRFARARIDVAAAWVMALLGAVATERFARAACTDYFAFTVFSSGLMLNLAVYFAREKMGKFSSWGSFLSGLVVGFSWYICRFSALYLVMAGVFFLEMLPQKEREKWLPTWKEATRSRLDRLWLVAIAFGTLLSVVAFFTNDAFLGINAESNLKIFVFAALLFWLKHRGRSLHRVAPLLACFAVGAIVGLAPELAFKLLVARKDRATGLVRWRDLAPLFPGEMLARVGINLSFYHARTLGALASAAVALTLLVGSLVAPGVRVYLLGVALCFGAWASIHTYMHLSAQYFFPVFYPLYLSLAYLVRRAPAAARALALATVLFLSIVGLEDLRANWALPHVVRASGVLDQLAEWERRYDIREGYGYMESNYNIMWAAKGRYFFPFLDQFDERFEKDQLRVRSARRVFHVHHRDDRQPQRIPSRYRILEERHFREGFDLYVLERE